MRPFRALALIMEDEVMRFLLFLVGFGLVATGCWFAYEKEAASENRQLRGDLLSAQQAAAASSSEVLKQKADFAAKQEAQKTALKLVFPQDAEKIENVFNPPAPKPAEAKAGAVAAPATPAEAK